MQRIKFLGHAKTFFLVFTIIPGLSLPLLGQSRSVGDSVTTQALNEVLIQSQLKNIRLTSATPVQIFKGEALERLNSLSLADALRFFSGVQIKDYGGVGGLKTINIRSMGSQHTAVFYDGLQITNAQNGQVDLGKFSLDNLELIELYNGQRTDLLQSASGFSSASSIFLKTKAPDFSDSKSVKGLFNLKGGSFALFNPSALLQFRLNDQLSASFSTSLMNANGKYKFRYTNGVYDTTAVRSNGDVYSLRFEAGLDGRLKSNGHWHLKFYSYDSERGLPGAVVSQKFDYSQRLWDKNLFVQASMEKKVNKRYSILINSKYADNQLRYLDPEITNLNGFLENKYKEKEAYFSLANKYELTSFWKISLATDYRYNQMHANLNGFPYPKRHTFLAALATQLNFNRFNLQVNALQSWVNDEVEKGARPGNKQRLSPSVMASWQTFRTPDFRFRAFYKSIFRLPSFNDLYFTQIGYRFLEPEISEQYDIGAVYSRMYTQQRLTRLDIQVDAYYNQVKNKIIASPGKSVGIWSMQNLGLVDIRGLEANLKSSWKIADVNLNAGASYTYQRAQDITQKGSSNYGNQIPYIPLHSGSFLLGVDYKDWGANYSFIYAGERYDQGAEIVYNYLQPWYTHDIAFFWKNEIHGRRLKVSAEINNLLNQYYDVVTNFPMPGVNYRFTLAYQI